MSCWRLEPTVAEWHRDVDATVLVAGATIQVGGVAEEVRIEDQHTVPRSPASAKNRAMRAPPVLNKYETPSLRERALCTRSGPVSEPRFGLAGRRAGWLTHRAMSKTVGSRMKAAHWAR